MYTSDGFTNPTRVKRKGGKSVECFRTHNAGTIKYCVRKHIVFVVDKINVIIWIYEIY